MMARKPWDIRLVLIFASLVAALLPACNGAEMPSVVPPPTPTLTPSVVVEPPVITIKQELQEQLDMLRALVEAEKGRGKDVSQAEQQLEEADQALQADDLSLAREKLRAAGEALGVDLP